MPSNNEPKRGLAARAIICIGKGFMYFGTGVAHLCKGFAAAVGLVVETAVVSTITTVAKTVATLDESIFAAIGTFTDSLYAADLYVRATFVTLFGFGAPKFRQQPTNPDVQALGPFPGNTVLDTVDQSYYVNRNRKAAQCINLAVENVGNKILSAYSLYVRPGFLPDPILDALVVRTEETSLEIATPQSTSSLVYV
jgi:hypothetical protein